MEPGFICTACDQLVTRIREAHRNYQHRATKDAYTSPAEVQRSYEVAQQIWREYRRHVATHAAEQVIRVSAAANR